jgi:N-acetylglucosamine-6-phosphate deacetylase
MLTALAQATILTGDAVIEGHALLVKDDQILDIIRDTQLPPDVRRLNYPGRLLAPGFIDAQVNGGGNRLFNQEPTAATAIAISRAHRAYGTTRLLLTCITDHFDVAPKALTAMRKARIQDKGILGLHAEGPHLAKSKRGIHQEKFIRPMIASDLKLYRRQDDEILLTTVAPENVTPEQITELCNYGGIISLGHTAAAPEQISAALAAGATGFTHLYNGMSGMSAREPGVAGVALADRDSWCGLIADGHHVSAEMIKLAVYAKPPGKIFLVSDAMPPAATNIPKPFKLYDQTIHLKSGRCSDDEGRLAGASITMADAVRHCVKIGIDLEESLRMASTYPAAFLGLPHLGKLLPGFLADIVVLDQHAHIEATWFAGQVVGIT